MFSRKCVERIEAIFRSRMLKVPSLEYEIESALKEYDTDIQLAMKYLYGTMPLSDMGNYAPLIFFDYARQGTYLWNNSPFTQNIPEDIFLNYVLYHRVNEEGIEPCRYNCNGIYR